MGMAQFQRVPQKNLHPARAPGSCIVLFDGIPHFFPSRHPTFEGLDIPVPQSDIPGRLPGGAPLHGSASVENDLLVLGQGEKPGLKVAEGNRALQLHLSEAAFILISADQQKPSRFQTLAGFLRTDTLDTHFSPL